MGVDAGDDADNDEDNAEEREYHVHERKGHDGCDCEGHHGPESAEECDRYATADRTGFGRNMPGAMFVGNHVVLAFEFPLAIECRQLGVSGETVNLLTELFGFGCQLVEDFRERGGVRPLDT